jgi:hypothetical protein
MKHYAIYLLLPVLLLGGGRNASGQVVAVTAELDTNVIAVGAGTSLRIFAQVVPAYRTNAAQIVTWYVDVLNTNSTVVQADYAAMQKNASDKDPLTSSTGFTTNGNRLGIYDTFLYLPGAGVSNRVELMSIPVTGLIGGTTQFRVRAGSGVPNLSDDFLVAALEGGDPFTGGDYSLATVNLQVLTPCALDLQITPVNGGGPGQQLLLSFTPCLGYNHYVQTRSSIDSGTWQDLPGAPHNSGSVFATNSTPHQFFRLKAIPY